MHTHLTFNSHPIPPLNFHPEYRPLYDGQLRDANGVLILNPTNPSPHNANPTPSADTNDNTAPSRILIIKSVMSSHSPALDAQINAPSNITVDGLTKIDFPINDPEDSLAVRVVAMFAHGQHYRVPRDLTLDTVWRVTRLCDEWGLKDLVAPYGHVWQKRVRDQCDMATEVEKLIAVSVFFLDATTLATAVEALVRCTRKGPGIDEWLWDGENGTQRALRWKEDIPSELWKNILTLRSHYIESTLSLPLRIAEQLMTDSAAAENHKPIKLDDPFRIKLPDPHCRGKAANKNECTDQFIGSIYRKMCGLNISRTPRGDKVHDPLRKIVVFGKDKFVFKSDFSGSAGHKTCYSGFNMRAYVEAQVQDIPVLAKSAANRFIERRRVRMRNAEREGAKPSGDGGNSRSDASTAAGANNMMKDVEADDNSGDKDLTFEDARGDLGKNGIDMADGNAESADMDVDERGNA